MKSLSTVKVVNLLKFLRVHRALNFVHVLIGMLVVKGADFGLPDTLLFLKAWLIFFFLLYCGLYGFNNYFDAEEDKKNGLKNDRVFARGLIGEKTAMAAIVLLITASFLATWLFLRQALWFWFFFLIANVLHTLVLKRINLFLAYFVTSITHPAKFALGLFLAGGRILDFWPILLMIWMGLFSCLTLKVDHEEPDYKKSGLGRWLRLIGLSVWLACGILLLSSKTTLSLAAAYYFLHYGAIVAGYYLFSKDVISFPRIG